MNVFTAFFNFVEFLFLFLFGTVTDVATRIRNMTVEELQRFRRALVMAACFPIVLVVVGGIAGNWSATAKGWIILLGAPVLLAQLFVLAWRRAVVGVAIGAVFEWGFRQTKGLRAVVFGGLRDYINVVMWIAYTEVAVCLVAAVIPIHEYPSMALVAFLALIGLAAHAVQTGREFTWPKRARTLLLVAFWVAIVVIVLPPLGAVPGGLRAVVNRFLTWIGAGIGTWLSGTGPGRVGAWLVQSATSIADRVADNPLSLLWVAGIALVAIVALVLVIRGRWWHALALGLLLLLAVPAVSWIGGKAGAGELGLPAAVSGPAVTLPKGVTKVATLQFRPDRWLDIRGMVTPVTHCTLFGGDYVGAQIMFADGSKDILPEDKWYPGKVPVALFKEKGTLVVFSAEVGTGDCGKRKS